MRGRLEDELSDPRRDVERESRRAQSKVERRWGDVARISAGSDTVAERFLDPAFDGTT